MLRLFVILAIAQVLGTGRPGTAVPAASPVMAPPPAETGTGAISGVVVDAASGAPLSGVLVNLSKPSRSTVRPQTRQVTDQKGRFVFVNLPANNSYSLSASRPGYLEGGYRSENGAGGSISLIVVREGEWVRDTRIALSRPGAISGTVIDERGEPVVGVYVRVLLRLRIQGRDELASGPVTTTDDRGMYRVAGLIPGRYVMQVPSIQASAPASTPLATGRGGVPTEAAMEITSETKLYIGRYPLPPPAADGQTLAYPMAFHPGTPAVADAATVELGRGEERSGINITLTPVPAGNVSGFVEGPSDALKNLTLRLLPAGLENLGQGAEMATTLVSADGRFTFLNVPAGTYTLDAPRRINELTTSSLSLFVPSLPAPPGTGGWGSMSQGVEGGPPGTQFMTRDFRSGASSYSGRTSITVGARDNNNVVLTLRRAATVSGTIVTDLDPNELAPPGPSVPILDPADGNPSMGMPRASYEPGNAGNEFQIEGALAGEYFLRPGPPWWLVKSIQWGGRDYTDVPFDLSATDSVSGVVLTVTNRTPVLMGTVRRRDGAPSIGATVIVFPVDSTQWTRYGLTPSRIKSVLSGAGGTYRMTTLPAGEYYAVALEGIRPTAWQDPDFLRSIEAGASRIRLTWGGTASQDLASVEER
jgi:hypothetical protein